MFHRYKKQNDKKLIHNTAKTVIHRHLSDATRVLPNQPHEKTERHKPLKTNTLRNKKNP